MDDESNKINFVITETDLSQERLDKLIAHLYPEFSRTIVKKMFEDGKITCNQKGTLALRKIPPVGSEITIELEPPKETDLVAQNIPLTILYEDEYLIIIDKQAGLVVHPAAGNPDQTLVNAILYHCHDIKSIGNERRPGIVHRLDKGTTGVMVVAKEQKTHEALTELFSKHDLTRKYTAIVQNNRSLSQGHIETMFNRSEHNRLKMTSKTTKGKVAISDYKTLHVRDGLAVVEFHLHTGRTHQIRVHCSEQLNAPIINDELYANPAQQLKLIPPHLMALIKEYDHPMLHAKQLSFKHPMTEVLLNFETTPPAPHLDLLNWIKEQK
jgi:23S rRNA pseudouridine1911/1915/1917 synthase